MERQIIGMADPYPADPTVNDRIDELNGSMTERRQLGWEVLGAWYAMTADLYVRCLLVVYRFWHGGWRRTRG